MPFILWSKDKVKNIYIHMLFQREILSEAITIKYKNWNKCTKLRETYVLKFYRFSEVQKMVWYIDIVAKYEQKLMYYKKLQSQ